MSVQFTLEGNDLSQSPQGQVMMLILSELRLHTQILLSIANGQPVVELPEFMRAQNFIEANVKLTS